MYQALYRKYRPSNFDEVVGQKTIIKILKNQIMNNKISHAYLFSGPRGTGKTSIAKIFSKIINCENIQQNTTTCNKCVFCTQNEYIDIIEIDAASNNGVDEIRELKSKINLVPSVGKYKIYIIDEVHMLSTGAFNALLKTLEEPPVHTIFILATTDPEKIPLTILSRCQRFDFKKISNDEIKTKLKEILTKENIEYDEQALEEISFLSEGGLRDAISLLDQTIAYTNGKITLEDIYNVCGTLSYKEIQLFLNDIYKQNLQGIIDTINNWDNRGKNFVKITNEILRNIKNIILVKKNIQVDNYEINDLCENIQVYNLIKLINIFNNNYEDIKKSLNPKLLFELNMLKIMEEFNENNIKTENVSLNIEEESIKPKENKININKEITEKRQEVKEKAEENKILKSNNYFPGNNFEEIIKKIKQIRISNSLAGFNKQYLKQFLVNDWDKIVNNKYNLENKKYIALLLDGKLKSIGNDYLIFVYKNKKDSELFNINLLNIENEVNKILNSKYKVISTYNDDWEEIKVLFNNNKKEYLFIEETEELINSMKKGNEENELESIFGSIVEME